MTCSIKFYFIVVAVVVENRFSSLGSQPANQLSNFKLIGGSTLVVVAIEWRDTDSRDRVGIRSVQHASQLAIDEFSMKENSSNL